MVSTQDGYTVLGRHSSNISEWISVHIGTYCIRMDNTIFHFLFVILFRRQLLTTMPNLLTLVCSYGSLITPGTKTALTCFFLKVRFFHECGWNILCYLPSNRTSVFYFLVYLYLKIA